MFGNIKRLIKHCWRAQSAALRTLPPEVLERLGQQISASEQHHSGEIRILVETALPFDYLRQNAPTRALTRERAVALFSELRIWDTANNNGVLIYLLLAEHAIEIVADRGLSERVDPALWQTLVRHMSDAFKQGDYEGGLSRVLDEVSAVLGQHFPLEPGKHNPNELPDTPVER